MRCRAAVVFASITFALARVSRGDVGEISFEAGFAHRALYRVPIELASFQFALGGRLPHVAYGFPLGFEVGRTREGLSVVQGTLGLSVDYVVGRARFGAGLGVGVISIARVTRNDQLVAISLDAVLRVSADVFRFGLWRAISDAEGPYTRAALFVATELRGNTASVWGPSVYLGVRY